MDIKRINLSGKSLGVCKFFNDEKSCAHTKRLQTTVTGFLSGTEWGKTRKQGKVKYEGPLVPR